MKISISREALQKAMRVVSGVVERRQQQNPVLSNVFLLAEGSSLKVIATDQEIELTATVTISRLMEEGGALVSCRKLNDICRVLSDETEILIDGGAEKTLIKADKSRFVVAALPVEQFPKANSFIGSRGFKISRLAFMRLIEKTAFAMAEEDVRYFLNGMLLEVGDMFLRTVAADGHRLAMQTMPFPVEGMAPVKIIIPRKGVLEILRVLGESSAETIAVSLGDASVQVVCDDLSVMTVLLGGKYPEYEKIIPSRGNLVVGATRTEFKDAICRASALLHEKFKGVRLCFSRGKLQIFANNPEKDEAEEEILVDFNGDDIELGFNARYLLEYLASVDGEKVKLTFSDPNCSVLLEEVGDGSGLCVLMPMRI